MPPEAVRLPCRENGEHGGCTTEMKHAAAVGRDMLVVADARAEVVAEFVVIAAGMSLVPPSGAGTTMRMG
ncbi:hypothetical protein ACFQX4_24850 [Roseomonas sp. GCM10028921]